MNPLEELYRAGLTSPELVQQAQNAKILRDIAAMRQSGMSDDQIRALGGGMNLAGGTALLGPAADSAGIASAYSLGRAQMAANLDAQRFDEQMALADRAAQPFNVVGYLEALKRTGAAYPLNTNTLTTIAGADTPAESAERQKLREFLQSSEPEPFARGGTMTLRRPAVLIDAMTGRPKATMAENGPEDLTETRGGFRVDPRPGVSQRMGRGRQDQILEMAVGRDGRYGVEDTPPMRNAHDMMGNQRMGRVKAAAGGMNVLTKLYDSPGNQAIRKAREGMSTGLNYGTSTTSPYGVQPAGGNVQYQRRADNSIQVVDAPANAPGLTLNEQVGNAPGHTRQITAEEAQQLSREAFKSSIDRQMEGVTRGDGSPAQNAYAYNGARALLEANAAGADFLTGGMKGGRTEADNAGLALLKGINPDIVRDAQRRMGRDGYKILEATRGGDGGAAARAYGNQQIQPTGPVTPVGNTAPQMQNTESQQKAAQLLSALGNNTLAPPEWVAQLKAGQIPGVNQLTPLFWGSLDDTQKQAIAGLLTSTGWVGNVSDIERSIDRMRPA